MSSNRLIYDTCAYKQTLEQSVGPLNYQLYPEDLKTATNVELNLEL